MVVHNKGSGRLADVPKKFAITSKIASGRRSLGFGIAHGLPRLRTMSWSSQYPSANGYGWSSRWNTSWPCNVCHTINTVTGKQKTQHMVQVQTYLLEATSVAIKTTPRHWSHAQNGPRPHLSSGRNPMLDAEKPLLLWTNIKNMVRGCATEHDV